MKRLCQGYCGKYWKIEKMTSVGEYGERFCPECYSKLMYRRYYGDNVND